LPREPLPPALARLARGEIALLVACVLAVRWAAVQACPIYDDAFISFRYARNLARGLGLVFNPGAEWEPVLGTTTPGYTLLLSLLARAGASLERAAIAANVALDATSALLLIDLSGRRRLRSTAIALGFACFPELARVSAGAMEAPLLLALTLGALHRRRARAWTQAGILAGLACTVRPEAVLLVAVLALPLWRDRRALARFALPVALIGVAYALTLTSVYGSPIPQSVRSKARFHGHSPALDTWREIATQAFLPRLAYLPALPLCALGAWRALRRDEPLRPLSLFALAIVGAYAAARPHTWGWYYYVPLTAWIAWLAGGVELVLSPLGERLPRAAALASRAGPALGALLPIAAVAALAPRLADPATENVYGPMREWAEETRAARPGATLLAGDIGAIGYFSDGFDGGVIYDHQGLTWPAALEIGSVPEMIRRYQPTFVMMTANRPALEPLLADPGFAPSYAPVRRFSITRAVDLSPALESLPVGWVQDYLVFERRP